MTTSQQRSVDANWGSKAKSGTAWMVVGFGAGQILRLGSNIVLAALLYEEVFALMGIVSTFMVGLTMLSDVGLKPSVVRHPRGDQPEFLNTVWTFQILRGITLYVVLLLLTIPITRVYGANDPAAYELYVLIPLIGLVLILDGAQSTRMLSAERHLQLARLTQIEVVVQLFMVALMIALAWYLRSVFALAFAAVLSSVLRTILSYSMLKGAPNFIAWDRNAVKDLFHFGKWLFVSTCLTFLTLQSDRLLVSGLFPLAEVGVYFMAVNLAMLVGVLVGKLQQSVIFPWYSRMLDEGVSLPAAFQKTRLVTLISVTYMVSLMFVAASPFFDFAYDERYAKAATYLPVILIGVWFSCLAGMYGAAFLAIGRSKWSAITSVSKLLVLCIALPPVMTMGGDLLIVSLVVVGGDMVRAATSQWLGFRQGLLNLKIDAAMLLLLILTCAAGYFTVNHIAVIANLHPLIKLVLIGITITLLFAPLFIKFAWPLLKGQRGGGVPSLTERPQT